MFGDRPHELRCRRLVASKTGECAVSYHTRGRVAHAAKQIQNEGEYQRAYRRLPFVKLHARYAKFRRVSNYFAAKQK